MNNKTYDYAKFVALVLLPALGTLYFGLAQIWHFPHPGDVVGSITVVDTFLGVILHVSTSSYHDANKVIEAGHITSTGIDEDNGMPNLAITLTKLPHEILTSKKMVLTVDPNAIKPAPLPPVEDPETPPN